jgi:hypothetical protein
VRRLCVGLRGRNGLPSRGFSEGWCRVRDFHPQPLRSERSVSGSWTNAAEKSVAGSEHLPTRNQLGTFNLQLVTLKVVHPAGLPPADSPFEAEDDNNFTTDAKAVSELTSE